MSQAHASDRDIVVDDVTLRVRDMGSGPALMMLHGLGADRRIWERAIARYADRWRVVAVDLPGHGASDKPDVWYTQRYFARVIRALGRVLQLDNIVLMGSSLGGRIALEIAATYPVWVRGLVLSAPAPLVGMWWKPMGWALSVLTAETLVRWLMPLGIDRGFFDPTLHAATVRRALMTEQFARDDVPAFARAVARAVGGVLSADAPSTSEIRQPTLLVWGREDRIVPLSNAEALQAVLPQARLVVVDECGHMPMLERPDAFLAATDDFVGELPLASSLAGGM